MKQKGFIPQEIIFSSTSECNLHCQHCFVHRSKEKLSIENAISFLQNCQNTTITKVGFTGGEPFLYLDFLLQITKAAVSMDYMFDQIMTNGDWWTNESELEETLTALYDAGYDGKIGLSFDSFHNQNPERIKTFVEQVQKILGQDSINIQYVEEKTTHQRIDYSFIKTLFPDIPVFILPQTYNYNCPKAWQSKKWFKDDFCQGPGNIFYVHTNGKIAPCCGFANEEPALFIGSICDSYEKLMQNAKENPMIKTCFNTGLHKKIKEWKKYCKNNPKAPVSKGKTSDICTFCQAVCKMDN